MTNMRDAAYFLGTKEGNSIIEQTMSKHPELKAALIQSLKDFKAQDKINLAGADKLVEMLKTGDKLTDSHIKQGIANSIDPQIPNKPLNLTQFTDVLNNLGISTKNMDFINGLNTFFQTQQSGATPDQASNIKISMPVLTSLISNKALLNSLSTLGQNTNSSMQKYLINNLQTTLDKKGIKTYANEQGDTVLEHSDEPLGSSNIEKVTPTPEDTSKYSISNPSTPPTINNKLNLYNLPASAIPATALNDIPPSFPPAPTPLKTLKDTGKGLIPSAVKPKNLFS